MGTRICVMNHGRVVQVGRPLEVYRDPADTFVAGFIGSPPANLLEAELSQADGAVRVRVAGRDLVLPRHRAADLDGLEGRRIVFGIRPEDIDVRAASVGAADGPQLPARLVAVEPLGAEISSSSRRTAWTRRSSLGSAPRSRSARASASRSS